jgi:hypothetical protein
MAISNLNLIPNAVGQGTEQNVYAQVVAPVPTALTQPLYVVKPDWDPTVPWKVQPGFWGPGVPQLNASALLQFDNRGNAWVLIFGTTLF